MTLNRACKASLRAKAKLFLESKNLYKVMYVFHGKLHKNSLRYSMSICKQIGNGRPSANMQSYRPFKDVHSKINLAEFEAFNLCKNTDRRGSRSPLLPGEEETDSIHVDLGNKSNLGTLRQV